MRGYTCRQKRNGGQFLVWMLNISKQCYVKQFLYMAVIITYFWSGMWSPDHNMVVDFRRSDLWEEFKMWHFYEIYSIWDSSNLIFPSTFVHRSFTRNNVFIVLDFWSGQNKDTVFTMKENSIPFCILFFVSWDIYNKQFYIY